MSSTRVTDEASFAKFFGALIPNLLITVVCVAVFSIIRTRRFGFLNVRQFFAPRCENYTNKRTPRVPPPPSSRKNMGDDDESSVEESSETSPLYRRLISHLEAVPRYGTTTAMHVATSMLSPLRHDDAEEDAGDARASLWNGPPIHERIWGWIPATLKYTDAEMWETHGPDSVSYLRFMRICIVLCAFTCSICLIFVLPVNASAKGDDVLGRDVSKLQVLTISNIPYDQRLRFITHLCATYVISAAAYFLIWFRYRAYVSIGKGFTGGPSHMSWLTANHPRAYTVMVTDLPPSLRNEEGLTAWFQKNMPISRVVCVSIVYKSAKLEKAHNKHASYVKHLRRALYRGAKRGKRPTRRTYLWGTLGAKMDAIDHFEGRVAHAEQTIQSLQADAERLGPSGAAFVTFDSMVPTRMQVYATDPLSYHRMLIRPAPDPSDVNWSHVAKSRYGNYVKRAMLYIAAFVLITVWGAVTTTIATTLGNLAALADSVGVLGDIRDTLPAGVWVQSLIQGYLPALFLGVALSLVEPVLKFVVRRSGYYRHSQTEWVTLLIYAAFLVINVIILTTLGGSALDIAKQLARDATSVEDVIKLFANSLPAQSTFFITYIMTIGIGRLPFTLFRVGDLFLSTVDLLRAVTPEERNYARRPRTFDYSQRAAQDILMISLVMMFSVVAPFITPFGLIYFVFAYVSQKHELIYCKAPEWESGGAIWPVLYHGLMASLLMFQTATIVLLSLKGFGGASALLPLPFCTVALWMVLHFNWYRLSKFGTLQGVPEEQLPREQLVDAFVQPLLQFPTELSEAEAMGKECAREHHHYHHDEEEQKIALVQESSSTEDIGVV